MHIGFGKTAMFWAIFIVLAHTWAKAYMVSGPSVCESVTAISLKVQQSQVYAECCWSHFRCQQWHGIFFATLFGVMQKSAFDVSCLTKTHSVLYYGCQHIVNNVTPLPFFQNILRVSL